MGRPSNLKKDVWKQFYQKNEKKGFTKTNYCLIASFFNGNAKFLRGNSAVISPARYDAHNLNRGDWRKFNWDCWSLLATPFLTREQLKSIDSSSSLSKFSQTRNFKFVCPDFWFTQTGNTSTILFVLVIFPKHTTSLGCHTVISTEVLRKYSQSFINNFSSVSARTSICLWKWTIGRLAGANTFPQKRQVPSWVTYRWDNPRAWIWRRIPWHKWRLQPCILTRGNTVFRAFQTAALKSKTTSSDFNSGIKNVNSANNCKWSCSHFPDIKQNAKGTVFFMFSSDDPM